MGLVVPTREKFMLCEKCRMYYQRLLTVWSFKITHILQKDYFDFINCSEILKVISRGLRCTVPVNLNWNYQQLKTLNGLGNLSFVFYYVTLFSAINLQSREPWARWAGGIVICVVTSSFILTILASVRVQELLHGPWWEAVHAIKDYPGRSVMLWIRRVAHLAKTISFRLCWAKVLQSWGPTSVLKSHLSNIKDPVYICVSEKQSISAVLSVV